MKIKTINLNYLLIKQTGNYCYFSTMDYRMKWTVDKRNELLNLLGDNFNNPELKSSILFLK